jgi:hypothetical protein
MNDTTTANPAQGENPQGSSTTPNPSPTTPEVLDFGKIISDDAKRLAVLKALGVPEKADDYAFDDKAFASDAKISEIAK